MSGQNGKQSRTDRMRQLANYIEDEEEITGNVHVHLPENFKGSVDADGTGRLKAISIPDTENTKPDNPKPSEAPKSGIPGILVIAFQGVSRINSWPAAIVALSLAALAALWLWLTKR